MRTSTASPRSFPARAAFAAIAIAVSGCSADVTRFDPPSLNLSDESAPGPQPPSGRLGDPQLAQPRSGLTGEGPTSLPPPSGRTAGLPQPSSSYTTPVAQPAERRVAPSTARPVAAGETVEVQAGDTLYSIARRHHVPVSALIEVNALGNNATIKPGQRLALPAAAGSSEAAPGRPAAPRFPHAKVAAPAAQPQAPAQATPGWDATHTMRPGESLYGIARQYRVALSELQRVNGITEPTRVRIGAVLKVPGTPGASNVAAAQQAPRPAPQPAAAPPETTAAPGVRVINRGPAASDAPAPVHAAEAPATAAARFRWPVRGRVLAGFGKRSDGTHNDGINLAVPMGTDIQAVEGGRVAYAGGEIPAYGNLVLIRHDNGWVSAYAHADRILVQRDEIVKRGQIIAKSGRTGSVDQPQVHFELRQGAKPVDPMPYLEKMTAAN
ncbi:MAG: peptidoglycan DD-metalloendopeptidase family protein [Hyphomicrobiaceae bacterium]|nr:peptidoglycan DD-metalloendopeptidase family protein [Hyphomicrobiaceae bacterium]